MAGNRELGLLPISANFEVQSGKPFDARMKVSTKADLFLHNTWESTDGGTYVYVGMLVVVAEDTIVENNGIYILKDLDFTQEANWQFGGGGSGGNTMFIDDRDTTVSIFGLKSGTSFPAPGIDVVELLRTIIYQYQMPEISFSQPNLFKTYEIGTTLNDTYVANYSISNFENVYANSNVVSSSSNSKIYFSDELAVASGSVEIIVDNLLLSTVGTITNKITGTDIHSDTFSKENALYSRRYMYNAIGNQGTTPLTSSEIRLLSKKFLSASDTGVLNMAIPSGTQEVSFYIPLSKSFTVIDTGNLNADLTGSFNETPLTLIHDGGISSNYKQCTIYLGALGYPTATNFAITIS